MPRREAGLTLLELVVASTMLLILATMALPMARVKIKRDREIELRRALREMRTAIDRYKDASDVGLIEVKADSEGYPESLEVLVEGVQVGPKADRKVRFLRPHLRLCNCSAGSSLVALASCRQI